MITPVCAEFGSVKVEVGVNGDKRQTVTVRHLSGGELLHCDVLAFLDDGQRTEWRSKITAKHPAAGPDLIALELPLVERVIQEIAKSKPEATAQAGQGQEIMFPDPEPWPDPVDLGLLLDDTIHLINRFTRPPSGGAEAAALWIGLTYCVQHTDVFPKLALTSATPRCGKSRVLSCLKGLAYKAESAANITPPALFRTIEMFGPALLIDEADQFLGGQPELIGLINAGHSRDSATIIRTVGDDHVPRRFNLYGPQAIAMIGRIPTPALADRCITIQMERKPTVDEVEDIQSHTFKGICAPLCSRWMRWAKDHGVELRDSDPERCPGLHDRARDNWRGLFGLADLAGPEWGKRARLVAQALTGTVEAEDLKETMLGDLWILFAADGGKEKLETDTILRAFHAMDDRPYSEWGRMKKPMTPVSLASILKTFKIKPKQMGVNALGENHRGYLRSDLSPVWSRYGIPAAIPAISEKPQQLTPFSTCYKSESDSGLENPVSALVSTPIAGIASQIPFPGEVVQGDTFWGPDDGQGVDG